MVYMDRKIDHVVRWTNGVVMVFDQYGSQMPEYQGLFEEVKARIAADAPEDARFSYASWRQGAFDEQTKDEWLAFVPEKKPDESAPSH